MPDFVIRRPKAVKEPLAAAGRRPPAAVAMRDKTPLGFQVQSKGGGPTQEKPIQVFRKLLSDFNSGLRVLSDLARNKPQEPSRAFQTGGFESSRAFPSGIVERHTHTVVNYPKPEPKVIRERTEVHTRSEPILSVSETNVSIPAPAVVAPQLLPRRGREYAAVTGADREARRQVFEPYKAGSPHHLPSAARLAQLLRADTMIRKGTLPKNQTIQNLAQAIREGRRREVADINPERVQRLLYDVAGGATRAQQLFFSPSIARMVDRHNMALQSVYNERLQGEKQRKALQFGTMVAPRHNEAAMPQTDSVPAAEHDDFRVGGTDVSTAGSVVPDDSSQETALLQMLAYNEGAHIAHAAAAERTRNREEGVPPMSMTRSEDRVIGNNGTPTREAGPGIAAMTESGSAGAGGLGGTGNVSTGRPGGPGSIKGGSAAHQPPMRVEGIALPSHEREETQSSSGSRSGSKPQTIKGQLTLTGHNGQSLGVADLDARTE